MSVSNGDHITLIQDDWVVIGDGGTIELGVVGLTQSSNVDQPFHNRTAFWLMTAFNFNSCSESSFNF